MRNVKGEKKLVICCVRNAYFIQLFSELALKKKKKVPDLLTKPHKSLGLKASLQFDNFTYHIPESTGEVLSTADNVSSAHASSIFESL